jgi:hypothetical protein
VIGDMSVPRQDGKDAQAVFGCIPPQSGSTIFNAWWFENGFQNKQFLTLFFAFDFQLSN